MWWRDAVLYQIYVRSFADANGDGHGDLQGIRSKLDYLEWLGVDVIWLTPIHPSPNADWGYDVSDFHGVHPDYGTLDDLDALVADAGARGLKVVLDLVPNHTSSEHPWFSDPAKRDWYVWADEPNNWTSTFGGTAWTKHPEVGRYYLHNFLPEQPDLNWWNQGVRDEFEETLRFWFDRGIAGFRIDVAHALIKDAELRDNPSVGKAKDRREERVYNMNRPEVHEIYRRWRTIAREYDPERVLLGETWVPNLAELAKYYGDDDELQLPMIFSFTLAHLDAAELREIVEGAQQTFPEHAWPVWCGSNHDIVRFPTRWCAGDEAKIRCASAAVARAPRDADPLLRRRARDGAGRDPCGRAARHGAQPRRRAHADAVGADGRPRVVDPPRRPDPQRRGPACGRDVDAVVHEAIARVAPLDAGARRKVRTRPSTRLRASGRGVAERGAWWRSISRIVRSPSRRSAA